MVPHLVTSFGMMVLFAGCSAERAAPDTTKSPPPPSVSYYSGNLKGGFDDGGGGGGGGGGAADAGGAKPAAKMVPPNWGQLKIIRSARLELTSTDVAGAEDRLQKLLEPLGGFLTTARSIATDQGRRLLAVIRVPSPQFDAVILAVRELGTVRNSTIEQEDVTVQMVDHESRLKVSRQEEARLVLLLDTAVGKLEDILRIEKELHRVREEIETTEQRLKLVSQQVELATIHFELTEVRPAPLVPEEPPKVYTDHIQTTVSQRFHKAFFGNGAAALEFGESILLVAVAMVPWIPYLVVASGLGYLAFKRMGHLA
jgi:hypothetical protein